MSLENSIARLAATPPPARKSLRFANAGKANARIRELEKALGLPAGESIFNIGAANARVSELETLLASKTAAAKPSAPPAVFTPKPAAAAVEVPTRAQLCAVAKILDLSTPGADVSAAALRGMVEKAAYQAGCRFPNMTAETELATKYWRPESFTGLARTVRATLQSKITAIFEK
jgi:hypothetical protein